MTREELIEVIRNELWRQVFARDENAETMEYQKQVWDYDWERTLPKAKAMLSALEAAGVRLVTADMLNAAFDAFDAADGHFRIDGDAGPWLTCDGHNAAFNAALAASPYAKDKPE